jgi:concanavalin A-like lectin/glucanase superfamily protein
MWDPRSGCTMAMATSWALAACGQVASHHEPDADGARCAPTPAGLAARRRGEMMLHDDLGRYNGMAAGNVAYAPGRHGSAFTFDGMEAVISVADADALWPAGSFSVEGWVNASTAGRLITKYECGGSCPGGTAASYSNWSLDIADGGFPEFALRATTDGVNLKLTDTQHAVTDGAWHHLVGVRDIQTRQLVLYVDGAVASSLPISGHQLDPLANTDGEVDPVTIGASRATSANGYIDYLRGSVDDVAYYNAALTIEQIQAIYAAPDGECKNQ